MRSVYDLTFLGLDVHKDTISVAVLDAGVDAPAVDKISSDGSSVRRLIGRFPDRSRLRVCYEAGPTGFELQRLLSSMGVSCEVVAPSLIPKAPGDKVKTDRRDCRRLARLHRAGELTAIRVPTPGEEGRTFGEPALTATFEHYRAVLAGRQPELRALESDLARYYRSGPFVDAVVVCRPRPTRAGSWTGRCRSTPPSPGCTSRARPPGGACRGRRPTQGARWNDKKSQLRWDEPDDRAIGRSRGGLTIKTHVLVDGRGRPLVLIVSPGQAGDSPALPRLLAELRVARPGRVDPGPPRAGCAATRRTPRSPCTRPDRTSSASPGCWVCPGLRSTESCGAGRHRGTPAPLQPMAGGAQVPSPR